MKKLFTLLVALTTIVCGLNAENLLTDSFKYDAGNLTLKDYKQGTSIVVDSKEWYYTTTTTAKIQVVDTALTFMGYCNNKAANAIQYKGSTNKAVRAFSEVNSGSIYYSLLLNVRATNANTSKNGIIMISDESTTSGSCFAQLRYMNDGDKYKLGITKIAETGVRWTSSIPTDSTILVVVRYDFKSGEKNDEVYMWINPTKMSEGKPTTWCVQDTASGTGNPWGANQKDDASAFTWMYLCPSSHTANIVLDEIRVATKWADLFEGGGTEPAISVPSSLDFGGIFQGETTSEQLTITGSSLKSDITISKTSSEISLSTTSFTKAEAEAGAELSVTLNAQTPGAYTDTLVITSDTIVKKVVIGWVTYPVTAIANVAALKAVTDQNGNYRFTGEVIVTRDTVIHDAVYSQNVREIFIQDATGATKIKDKSTKSWDATNLVGSKITGFIVTPFDTISSLVSFDPLTKPTISGTGSVTPQEVTLSELQANGKDYLLELVKIKKVAFAEAGSTFVVGLSAISQDAESADVKVENNNIVDKAIPAEADVIGFCFNTSGSVILPRNINDIIEVDPELLKNGSFEHWKESSAGMLGKNTDFDNWNASGITFGAKAVDSTTVLDGKYAFKTTSDYKQAGGYIYQELNCQDYNTGDEFKVRINHKNLNQVDSALVLDFYWTSSISGTAMGQTDEMKQELVYSTDWKKTDFTTTKPEGAKYFYYKIKIKNGALVILDDCAFTYIYPTTTTVEEMPAMEMKARKVICNGQLLIIRDGIFYSITGQRL